MRAWSKPICGDWRLPILLTEHEDFGVPAGREVCAGVTYTTP